MSLSVRYGPIPFTIKELWFNGNETGYFIKQADMPGSGLLKFPTVVVDFTMKDGVYDTFTSFGCLNLLGVPTIEIVFSTRERVPAAGVYDNMVQTARNLGIKFGTPNIPDWSKCPK